MKKLTTLFLAAGLFVAVAGFILSSCTKEGPQGASGANGTNGINGTNAAATCQECHNFSDTIIAKIFQYNASNHASGSTVFESSRTDCAPCHSSQGFAEVNTTGMFKTAAGIPDAAPINCRTCHQIHKTYTSSDWSLAITSPYRMRYDSTVTINFIPDGGSANLCGRCHQARSTSPWLTLPNSDTDSLNITSSRWGPHHGTQSNILAGKGGFNDASFGTSPHKDKIGCIGCHGGNAQGNFVGGHTLTMSSSETGDNIAVCKPCHSSATSFDIGGDQSTIRDLHQQLKVILATRNMLDTVNILLKPRKYSQADLAAYWNYLMIDGDRSNGVHNFQYTFDMLTAAITHFNGKRN